jgi:hypothetical protein
LDIAFAWESSFSLIGLFELVVVRGVPLGDLLFPYFAAELAVRLHAGTAGKSFLLIPENPA